ncbi:RagB/SusD family nutrient uptake outer membrane protein [Daejeonella sp.]|uniref:RagB/SusD family nutrient uptake outer membrane protein n=1 Tax=Daejeonella sp. TaxID=2805397 RepID=UPI00398343D9
MKNKLIILTMFTVALVSCRKELLSPIPQTAISDAVAFATPERVAQQVLGMYSEVKTGDFYAGRYLIYNDVRGEDFLNRTLNFVTAYETWNFNVVSSSREVRGFWGAAYSAINGCNVVLDGLETAPIAAALKEQYRGEARFLRALSYYSLLTLYARPYWDGNGAKDGVPLRLKAETTGENRNLARSSVAAIYTQILKDLDFAETNLPLTYSTAYNRTTRAQRNTAIALKTRVYLSMRQYDKVITEADKIVSATPPFVATSGVANRLEPTIAGVFAAPYTSAENILSFAYSALDLPGGQASLNSYYNPPPNGLGDYYLNPSGIVSDAGWKSTDARRVFNQVSVGLTFLRKWPKNGGIDPDYVNSIRYAEILLNLAEATVRQNNTVDARAVALLNAVRQRSDASTTFTVAGFATPQSLLDQIAIERRIELLGEGFRSIDRLRLGQALPAKGTVQSIAPADAHYIWPIPLSELLVNKAMTQNPGH